jgi:hypothetical protein
MIRVCVEVREGATLSKARVQAESIRDAVSITQGRYPGRQVRVMFPIDPEDFFIEGPQSTMQDPTKGNSQRRHSARPRSTGTGASLTSRYLPLREER